MNSPSILDLERLSLVDSNTLSSLPSPDSSSAPTLCSLPPELLTQIFKATQTSPSSKATLASLCRINHFFFEIARPLLYHEVHLDLNLRNGSSSKHTKLLETLLFASPCAQRVKGIRISLKVYSEDVDWILLRSVLRQCKGIERLSTGWNRWGGSTADQVKFIETISKEATSIKSLEIPNMRLGLPATIQLVESLRNLDTLVFEPVSTSSQIISLLNLRKVVWQSRLLHRALGIYLSSSRHTLTSMSFQFEYAEPPMLDIFPNLSTLRLALGSRSAKPPSKLPPVSTENCAQAIRAVLLSTHSLPLRYLTISTTLSGTARALANYSILASLPGTILSFSTVPQLLGCLNLPSLLPDSNDTHPYPCLRRLTIIPATSATSLVKDDFSTKILDALDVMEAVQKVSEVLEKKEVEIIVEFCEFDDRGGRSWLACGE